jgi:hypothetical protein
VDREFNFASRFTLLVGGHKTVDAFIFGHSLLDAQLVNVGTFLASDADTFACRRLDLDAVLQPMQEKLA